MNIVVKNFIELTKIPHCSQDADALMSFLVDFARDRGYNTEVDGTGNIWVFKGKSKLCLQAHYDMVCMGKAPDIETYEEDGWLKAKESSLGADNGMAIAMMMSLMDEALELEFLFTADEEVGLIGAKAVGFPLHAHYMLNLDFEDEAMVCIGCAGGIDIIASCDGEFVDGSAECYEVAINGLPGGHSGVDIDKDIPSAIKLLARYLKEQDITQIAYLLGGERSNSIPANAVAIIRANKEPKSTDKIKVRRLNETPKVYANSSNNIDMIDGFEHGVREFDDELGIPSSSINLATVTADENGKIVMELSARAMDAETLEMLGAESGSYFESYGMSIKTKDKYPAWKPQKGKFVNSVEVHMQKQFGKSKLYAIHAGLECGVLSDKYPQIEFASIGPTIQYPHSTREKVNLKSVKNTYKVLQSIIKDIFSDVQ